MRRQPQSNLYIVNSLNVTKKQTTRSVFLLALHRNASLEQFIASVGSDRENFEILWCSALAIVVVSSFLESS